MSHTRILLGGVPFGCNNIGDEAILARVVEIVRQVSPSADITVSTGDPVNTPSLLSVKTCPLYGFTDDARQKELFVQTLSQNDIFIWAGATGLSDYPDTGLNCLVEAQKLGVKTIVFCTGMNDTLNPAHFRLSNGKKFALCSVLTAVCGYKIDFVKTYENRKERALRNRLKHVLDSCDLVVNRDQQSKTELMRSELSTPPIVAADPAITLPLNNPSSALWGEDMMSFLSTHKKLIGVCISSQQALSEKKEFTNWLDKIVSKLGVGIVFIPMNPITDFECMANLRDGMFKRSESIIAQGSSAPDAVAGLASKMDIIISSRLHLLIFASISATPCIGIGRGSKVSNFLSEFGFCTAGTTQKIKFDYLDKEVDKLFREKAMYQEISIIVRQKMLRRLEVGIKALADVVNPSYG